MYCRPDFPSCPGNPIPVAREFPFSRKTGREGKGREGKNLYFQPSYNKDNNISLGERKPSLPHITLANWGTRGTFYY